MKIILATTAIAVVSSAAHADRFDYTCKVGGQSMPLKLDDAKGTLQWLGKTYKIKEQPGCPRLGWRAERAGGAFDFCPATQGMVDFHYGQFHVQCDQR